MVVSKEKLDMKSLATDVLSSGLEVTDAVFAKVETAKEEAEDVVAEARHLVEQRTEMEAKESC